MSIDGFKQRFESECRKHIEQGRAKSFAFIFYNHSDEGLLEVLKKQGVFAELDRLSGTELTVFYLLSDQDQALAEFNSHFQAVVGLQPTNEPSVVFFKMTATGPEDVLLVNLDRTHITTAFHELFVVIESYLRGQGKPADKPKHLTLTRKAGNFIGVEAAKEAVKESSSGLFGFLIGLASHFHKFF